MMGKNQSVGNGRTKWLGGPGCGPWAACCTPLLYDNCWAIRLIAPLLLTFMSHIRPVPSPQGGFGGLSPPKQCSKPPQI